MRAWTAPIQAAKSVVLLGTRESLQSVGFEHLHLLLGLCELGLAILRKLQAALVRGEGLFEGELPRFHAGDELFQLGQCGFETEGLAAGGSWLGRFGHGWNKTLQNVKIAELHPASQIKNTVKF
jgi:hypothetical protein